jgi:ubiquitin carboxyl-terminal hydrolase 4/11/15
VVDICFGQYKSHITCSECLNVSITFDPFSSLSLPIPVKNTKTVTIHIQLLPIGSCRLSVNIEIMVRDLSTINPSTCHLSN